jgi:hypothetical protein
MIFALFDYIASYLQSHLRRSQSLLFRFRKPIKYNAPQ